MNYLHRPIVAVVVVLLVVGHGMFSALAQPGPWEPRGTQLYRGTDVGGDPGRPMIVACIDGQPCRFVGLVDPGAPAIGGFIVDGGYFTVCTPGVCGTPVPFLATPVLAATSLGAGTGLSTAAIAGTVAGTTAVGLAVGLGVGLTRGSDNNPSPSQ
jgi:hypothetical protein